MVRIAELRLALTVLLEPIHMIMKYLDVTTVFLESKVNEELDMILSKVVVFLEGCLRVSSGTQVQVHARLLNSLYGLKQMSLNYFETLENFLTFFELQRLRTELGIYVQLEMDN